MARLAGVDIPREKRVEVALTYIYGVGKTRAHETLAATGVNPDTRVKDLTDQELVHFVTSSKATTRLKVIFAARLQLTSAVRLKSVPTRACATAAACRFTVSAPRPTHVPVRARSVPSQVRRSKTRCSVGYLYPTNV